MSTILVIEDSQDNFDLIEDALEDAHELVHAKTGQEGLAQAETIRPDLIFLDMGLPGMDGWEVARRLKADHHLAAVPIIAVTAYAMTGDREKCFGAGCDDYLSKPIAVQDLVQLTDRHISRSAAL
jgi:two-component system cell cycle response regulator DivK